MDFDWSEDRLELRRGAVEFATRRLVEGVTERDREGVFSRELWDACAGFGLQGAAVPERWGGGGHDLLSAVAILEGVGYGARDNGMVFSVTAHAASCVALLAEFGSEEQKREWLPRLAAGSAVGATGVTEPDSGSSALALATTATESGGDWVLDGTKTFVTNAPVADLFVVFARTDGPGASGVSAFLVRKDDGVTVSREIAKMGLHTSSTVELLFDGVEIAADRQLGERGQGMRIAFSTLDAGRIAVAAQAVGIARAALELATRYAGERHAFGGPIARFQGVQFPIADVAAKIDAARLLTLHAARVCDAGRPCTQEGAKAKLFASSVAVEASDVAVQTLGGYGYSAEFPAERYYRDAKITELYEGTSEIQRLVIARGLMGDAARG